MLALQVVDVDIDPVADLLISQEVSIDPVTAGNELTYTLANNLVSAVTGRVRFWRGS